jgi:hypothetical protein
MHSIYVEIVCEEIKDKYGSESKFVKTILGIDWVKWEAWKEERGTLAPEVNQKIIHLFSDYEWMLVQKVLRQTIIYPEKRLLALAEYRKMKLVIAKEWIEHQLGLVEMVQKEQGADGKQWINLKVTLSYGEWGFDDVLTFRVPAVLQHVLTGEKQALLEWMDESIIH